MQQAQKHLIRLDKHWENQDICTIIELQLLAIALACDESSSSS